MMPHIDSTKLSSKIEMGDDGYKLNNVIQKRMKVIGGRISSNIRTEESQAKGKVLPGGEEV